MISKYKLYLFLFLFLQVSSYSADIFLIAIFPKLLINRSIEDHIRKTPFRLFWRLNTVSRQRGVNQDIGAKVYLFFVSKRYPRHAVRRLV